MRFDSSDRGPSQIARARSLRSRMTWAERELWKALRQLRFNFRRQAPIGSYIVDFACHRAGLIIEVDGGVHERLDAVWRRDVERQLWLESQGYKVIRFPNGRIERDLEGCIREVTALLAPGARAKACAARDLSRDPPRDAGEERRVRSLGAVRDPIPPRPAGVLRHDA